MNLHRRLAIAITVLAVMVIALALIAATTRSTALWYLDIIVLAAAVSLMVRALKAEAYDRAEAARLAAEQDPSEPTDPTAS